MRIAHAQKLDLLSGTVDSSCSVTDLVFIRHDTHLSMMHISLNLQVDINHDC